MTMTRLGTELSENRIAIPAFRPTTTTNRYPSPRPGSRPLQRSTAPTTTRSGRIATRPIWVADMILRRAMSRSI
jgi:hypothetical protein